MDAMRIRRLWDNYGMAEEECQLADLPIEVVVSGEDMRDLLDAAEMLAALEWAETFSDMYGSCDGCPFNRSGCKAQCIDVWIVRAEWLSAYRKEAAHE